MDGVDVAACELALSGDTAELRPLGHTASGYPPELRERLLAALPPAATTAAELCELDTEVGRCFAEVAADALRRFGPADLVSSLGQTIYHWVEDGRARGTLQLGQPAWIAERTGLPVVADLRARDVAAGGHGAPLVGVLDSLWLGGEPGVSIALNIGGIANISVVGGAHPLAYDTGPGNALIDAAARMVTGGELAHDVDGAIAATGSVRADLLKVLLDDPYYALEPPKSTGKEHFNRAYLARVLDGCGRVDDGDLLATLTELTAATIADACRGADRVVASGGGTANPVLLAALRNRLADHGVPLGTSDQFGLPADGKEAYLTALLGFLTAHGLPGNVPGTTGARGPRLLGAITPGRAPLALPEPAAETPRRLRILRPEPEWRPRASR
ncbi:anhydro-N-acetylmuramic acid kinase [Saccharopolyspora taberi]|uniref:Anhydro-N-acetylmuramic acid kinase n=2 Tax=Saccharopolyspora taberi TaxID=60895 RepID=A0ABN3V5W1_9PSEU